MTKVDATRRRDANRITTRWTEAGNAIAWVLKPMAIHVGWSARSTRTLSGYPTLPIEYYEIETAIQGSTVETSTVRAESTIEAERLIRQLPDAPLFVLVAALGHGVDYGNFLIWSTDDRAIAKLHEHREFVASLPAQPISVRRVASFFDPDGSALIESYENTIPRKLAFHALSHWLKTMERLPDLNWQ